MAVKQIKIAVVGTGFMGATHLRIYQQMPGVCIASVCDVSGRIKNGVLPGVAGNIQQAVGLRLGPEVKIVSSFDALLEREVDVIDICSPTRFHAEQAMAALRAGKHVICEKPLAPTAAQARAVARVATGAKGFLMPAMCMRFWPGWAGLKEVVTEQTYGKVLAAGFRRVTARPAWATGDSHPGGALLDLHIHDTDFVHFLFGRPEKVFSNGVVGPGGAVDHVVTQFIYRRGPVVHAEGSWLLVGGFNMSFALHCERATLDFDFQRGAHVLHITLPGKEPRFAKLKGTDGYEAELRHFIDCVRRGEPSRIVSAQDAVTCLQICEAEEKSVRAKGIARL